mgnify:FL=1
MKNKLFIVLAIVLLCTALVLCACDDTGNDGDGNGTLVACNCPNCHDGVCGCDQCKGDSDTPKPEYYENLKFRDTVNYDMDAGETAKFAVKNDYNGKYIVAIDTTAFEVYMDEKKATATADGFVVDVWKTGQTMKITNVSDQTKNLSFTFDVVANDTGESGYYAVKNTLHIVRIVVSETKMYTFKCSENENIIDIYNLNSAGILLRTRLLDGYNATDEIDLFLTSGAEYYVVTEYNNDTVGTGSLQVNEQTREIKFNDDTIFDTLKYGNFFYAKFVVPQGNETGEFVIKITGVETQGKDYYNFRLINDKGELCWINSSNYQMTTYNLRAGETYYIGIRAYNATKVSYTITVK